MEHQAHEEKCESKRKSKISAVQAAFEAPKDFEAAFNNLHREMKAGDDRPVGFHSEEVFAADKEVEKALVELQQSEENARKVVNDEA